MPAIQLQKPVYFDIRTYILYIHTEIIYKLFHGFQAMNKEVKCNVWLAGQVIGETFLDILI